MAAALADLLEGCNLYRQARRVALAVAPRAKAQVEDDEQSSEAADQLGTARHVEGCSTQYGQQNQTDLTSLGTARHVEGPCARRHST